MAFLRRHVQTITPGAASDRFFMGLLVIVDVRSDAEWSRVRSALAARRAARQRDDVATVASGMNAWLAAGLPAARCAPPNPTTRTP